MDLIITLDNEDHDDWTIDNSNADGLRLKRIEHLDSFWCKRVVFNPYTSDWDDIPQDEADIPEDSFKIYAISWSNESSEFEEYVSEWLNDCDSAVEWKDLLHGGVQSGMTELIHTSTAMEVFGQFKSDIEAKVQQVVGDLGDAEFLFDDKRGGFSLDKIVWLAFEETVRDALSIFGLEDI